MAKLDLHFGTVGGRTTEAAPMSVLRADGLAYSEVITTASWAEIALDPSGPQNQLWVAYAAEGAVDLAHAPPGTASGSLTVIARLREGRDIVLVAEPGKRLYARNLGGA